MVSMIAAGNRRWRGTVADHPQLVDAALGVVTMAMVLAATIIGGDDHDSRALLLGDYAAAAAAAALVAVRRRWPLPVFAVATLATAAAMTDVAFLPQCAAAALVCAYTVATTTRRTRAWSATAIASVVVYLAAVLLAGTAWDQPETVTAVAWGGMATALGDVVRTRRAYLVAVLERARRAEQSRDEEARHRVIEERLRIARELHDVVANNIAMINVQAGVAAHVLADQPDKAQESLAAVRLAACTVLEELSTVLGVLRGADDPPDAAGEPPPGLSRLRRLLHTFAANGLTVRHTQEGCARDLPAAVDLAAFRIVQEALTNAHKHGSGGVARLHLAYADHDVCIEVDNVASPHASRTSTGTGYGLLGIRERAGAVGGSVTAGCDDAGHFRVRAQLPALAVREALR
jgi:signal transduction histidine kinase